MQDDITPKCLYFSHGHPVEAGENELVQVVTWLTSVIISVNWLQEPFRVRVVCPKLGHTLPKQQTFIPIDFCTKKLYLQKFLMDCEIDLFLFFFIFV